MEAGSECGIVHKTFCQTGNHFSLDTWEHTIHQQFTNKLFYEKKKKTNNAPLTGPSQDVSCQPDPLARKLKGINIRA